MQQSPAAVMRPIRLEAVSVNQSAPSGPVVISEGAAGTVGIGYSVMSPSVVMRPILSPFSSVNQRAPSGPTVIPEGWLPAVGSGYSVSATAGAGAASAAIKPISDPKTRLRPDRAPRPVAKLP